MNQRITLSRRELYDLVWSKPMRDVAVELGLSDVGLAKVCDRHRVPRPEQGYWNKIRAGQPAKKTIFVETDDPHVNRIVLQGGISSLPEAARAVIQEARENRKHRPKSTTVAAQIPSQIVEDPHAAIAKTAKVLRKAVADSMGAVHANGEGLCGVSVASDRRERAIFILDGLARELSKNGLALAPTGQAMSIEIGPDSAVFTLKERIRREKHVPTGEELAAEEKRLQAVRKKYGAISWFERPSDRAYPEFDTIYTGELVLQVDGYSEGVRRTWADGRTQVIDTMIDDIVTGLRAILAARKEGREKREAQHRAWEELRERRKLAEMRSARETRRIEYFQGLLDTGSEIAELRRWLSQMQDVGDTSLPQVGRLIAWVKERLGALEEALLLDAIAADLDANRLFPEIDDLVDPLGEPEEDDEW